MILDRMEIEEAGPDPAAIAAAIHAQLGCLGRAVPIHEIAMALDIIEIREETPKAFEGALFMTPGRGYGAIIINKASMRQRQRFTIAHELGHFLNPHHRPANAKAFFCTVSDLGATGTSGAGAPSRQEAEANRFAIDLLAPAHAFAEAVGDVPDLQQVCYLASALDLSREACARRYIELRPWPCALVFSKDGVVRYTERNSGFPNVMPGRGRALPYLSDGPFEEGVGQMIEADPLQWHLRDMPGSLTVQTLHQMNGYSTTLFMVEPTDATA